MEIDMTDTASAAPTYQQIVASWNAQADEYNQWDDLGEDEKIEWAMACAKAAPPTTGEPRWYMVDKDGMAALCTDMEDAEQEAKDANMAWPHTAPHRAVQLVEVGTLAAELHHSPTEGMAGGWIALPGTLPEPGTPVLLDIGKEYPIRAMWAAKHTVQAADDDSDWGEYVEEDDMYYAPEGWYEWNQCEDNHWRVTETPRAWMPLPPTTSAGSGKV